MTQPPPDDAHHGHDAHEAHDGLAEPAAEAPAEATPVAPAELPFEPALEPTPPAAAAVVDEPSTAAAPAPSEVTDAPPAPMAVVDAGAEPIEHRTASSSGRFAVPVLGFLVVLLLLLTGWLAYVVSDARGPAPIESSRKAALDAGREAARLIFSYDYRHLDKDFKAGAAVTTGKFRTEYDNTTSKLVGDYAPQYKAVLVSDVSEAGVVSASANQVVLLEFVDVQSTSTRANNPKVTPRRLKLTMQRVGGRWLVADVDAF